MNTRIISGKLCWERKPTRYETNELQAIMVINFVVCGVFFLVCGLVLHLIGHDTMNIPKIILGIHKFICKR